MIRRIVHIVILLLIAHVQSLAQSPDSLATPSKDSSLFRKWKAVPLSSKSVVDYLGHFGTSSKASNEGVLFKDLRFSGAMQLMTIYRNMELAYSDMNTSRKNISFSNYPLVGIASSGGVGTPLMNLNLSSKVNRHVSFLINYSLSHTYGANTRLGSNGGMHFISNVSLGPAQVKLTVGGLVETQMSRFIFGRSGYRHDHFNKLPWERSVTRKYTANQDPDAMERSWPSVKGVIAEVTHRKSRTSFKGIYGRTSKSIGGDFYLELFPSVTYAGGLTKQFGDSKKANGFVSLNYYKKSADIDAYSSIKDDIDLATTAFEWKKEGLLKLEGEFGLGKVNNPLTQNTWGTTYVVGISDPLKVPLSVEYFSVDPQVGNIDGAIINSNPLIKDGGATGSAGFDNSIFVNSGLEVGQITSNRTGVSAKFRPKVKSLKVEFGIMASVEKENIYDTVTFQHKVNSFSRSRFTQWRQGIGPYGRIKSVWFRTFEIVSITDEGNGIATDYKKGFNSVELLLDYKKVIFGRTFTFYNFTNFISFQDKFSPLPVVNNTAFVRTFFNDFLIAVRMSKKVLLLANYAVERVVANDRTQLSPTNNKPIDQTGYALGIGAGYDFSNNVGLNLRHKWMSHKDINFDEDRFKGQETFLELKIIF